MDKIKKYLNPALAVLALIGAILKILRNANFNMVLSGLFLLGGLLLLIIEITNKENRKLWIRTLLILIPILIVGLPIQNLVTNTYSSSIIISLGMYYLLSERYMLLPKKS